MATIRQLNSGKWNVMIRRRGQPAIYKTFAHEAKAIEWARAIEIDIDNGVFQKKLEIASTPTLAEVMREYGKSGASAESVGVGNEGIVGVSLFMGGETTPSSAEVQTAGYAYRIKSRLLQQEFNRAGQVQRLLLRYTQALCRPLNDHCSG